MTAVTPSPHDGPLLDALLDAWRRNNLILINLLQALPESAMDLRATDGSPRVAQLFMHMHYCRMVFVHETAPEVGAVVPTGEWRGERDRDRIAAMLHESADAMRDAVRERLLAGRQMDQHYDHPVLMLQHFVWHEGYHHGQIKIALKEAGRPGVALEENVTPAQRRSDALGLLAECALAADLDRGTSGDRY